MDKGDPSRYHEIIALSYINDKWEIIEDYLTPEVRFFRKTKIIINESSEKELRKWLEKFVENHENEIINDKIDIKNGLKLL